MDDLLYRIKEWWTLHQRNAKRYGVCALLIVLGLRNGAWAPAWIGLGAAFCMFCYDRFNGEYWRQRGAQVLGQDKKDRNPPA